MNNRNSGTSSVEKFWIYGKHAVISALANTNRKIYQLLATNSSVKEIGHLAHNRNLRPQIIEVKELIKMLPQGTVHQNLAMQVGPLQSLTIEDLCRNIGKVSCLLILDQVTDPHNVGAILRSCAAFSVDALILTTNHSPNETGALAKAACGALELVPIIKVVNLSSTIDYLKGHGYWCVGLEGESEDTITSIKMPEKTAFIMGSEDNGLRRLTRDKCDFLVKLSISKQMESLNVSNAAAISLYEYSRIYRKF